MDKGKEPKEVQKEPQLEIENVFEIAPRYFIKQVKENDNGKTA